MDQTSIAAAEPASNIPDYSVSALANAVKRTLEGNFGRVRVRGEITEVKRYPSGHIYFALKDEAAKLQGIVWKFAVPKLGLLPENGVEVVATGKLSSYPDRSTYQLIIDRLEFAGAGAMLARIEALRLRLAAEGLFAETRKPALPLLPSLIGVVSSERGAVIQDIRTTIARRFPRPMLLWAVPVQGEGAAARIAAAIEGFNALPAAAPGSDPAALRRPDVLIIARGGGSLEDLMAFNDEAVVRAAANSLIPLISAVGHETDTTLIDHAAARRAPTPTAAAELAIPARRDLLADLSHRSARLDGAYNRAAQTANLRLQRAIAGLPDLPPLAAAARQRLDDREDRLARAAPTLLAAKLAGLRGADRLRAALPALVALRKTSLTRLAAQLPFALHRSVADAATRSAATGARLSGASLLSRVADSHQRIKAIWAHLHAVSPHAVLARGYALVTGPAGTPVTKAAAIAPGTHLTLRFVDGKIGVTVPQTRDARQGRLEI
jgi:exodeoxyribonuclease VII large subunit